MPDASLRTPRDLGPPAETPDSVFVELTDGALNNNYIPFLAAMRLFPADAVGGRNMEAAARRKIALSFVPGSTAVTDIDGKKKFPRVRGRIVREFYANSHAKPGDQVRITRTGEYTGEVRLTGRRGSALRPRATAAGSEALEAAWVDLPATGAEPAKRPFYVYVLRDDAGQAFYVGKGKGMRALQHVFREDRAGGPQKQAIIDRIRGTNGKIAIEVIERFATTEEALAREAALIREFGTLHDGCGPLTNRTLGRPASSLSPAQCRAGRGLVSMTQQQLADASGVSLRTITNFEKGDRTPIPANLAALKGALSEAGVEFDEAGGVRPRGKAEAP